MLAPVIATSIGTERNVLVRENSIAVLPAAAFAGASRLGILVADVQRLLLVRPDDEPDIEPHDDGEPHADADEDVLRHGKARIVQRAERQRLQQVALVPGEQRGR